MTYLQIITNAAKAAKVSAILLYATCAHESRDFSLDFALYDNGSPSFGVCQVKLETAKMFGFHGDPMELRNAVTSTKYAALYLKYQQQRYGESDWLKLVAAYNAGSYSEGKILGCPKNLRYVKLVQAKLPEELKYKLRCGQ
jgi:soluble lytic murein transglycosylase-like protein